MSDLALAALVGAVLGGLVAWKSTWNLTIWGTSHVFKKMIQQGHFTYLGRRYVIREDKRNDIE